MNIKKPDTVLTIIVMLATVLFSLWGIFLQQYIPVIQFLVIIIACGILIFVLIWLPKRTSEYFVKHLHHIDSKLLEMIEFNKESKKEIFSIQNRVTNLCIELTDGTEQRMSWTFFWTCVRTLRDVIQADSAFKPDVVLSVGRSGAIVGSMLAGNMNGILHIGIDRINHWKTEHGMSSRTVEIYPSPQNIEKVLIGKNILCVMSECDSGRTLDALVNELDKINGIGSVKTAILFRNANTFFRPDYVAKEDQGRRPKFPFRTTDWKDDSKLPLL